MGTLCATEPFSLLHTVHNRFHLVLFIGARAEGPISGFKARLPPANQAFRAAAGFVHISTGTTTTTESIYLFCG